MLDFVKFIRLHLQPQTRTKMQNNHTYQSILRKEVKGFESLTSRGLCVL